MAIAPVTAHASRRASPQPGSESPATRGRSSSRRRSAPSSSGTTSTCTARSRRSSPSSSSPALNETSAFIFALLAFAAGFAVRPFGAIVFGRLGDLIGRKYTFLVTILIMGLLDVDRRPAARRTRRSASRRRSSSSACASCRASRSAASTAARRPTWPSTRPPGKRGFFTSWIQTTATRRPVPLAARDPRHAASSLGPSSSTSGAGASRSSSPLCCSRSPSTSGSSCRSRRCSSG